MSPYMLNPCGSCPCHKEESPHNITHRRYSFDPDEPTAEPDVEWDRDYMVGLNAVAVDQSDGAIYLGTSGVNADQRYRLARYESNGAQTWKSLFTTEGAGAERVVSIKTAPEGVDRLAIHRDGPTGINIFKKSTGALVASNSSSGAYNWAYAWMGDKIVALNATFRSNAIDSSTGLSTAFGQYNVNSWNYPWGGTQSSGYVSSGNYVYCLATSSSYFPPVTVGLFRQSIVPPATILWEIIGLCPYTSLIPSGAANALFSGDKLIRYSDGSFAIRVFLYTTFGGLIRRRLWHFDNSGPVTVAGANPAVSAPLLQTRHHVDDDRYLIDYDRASDDSTLLLMGTSRTFPYVDGAGRPPNLLVKLDASYGQIWSHEISATRGSGQALAVHGRNPVVAGVRVSSAESE